ncbi:MULTISPECIES: hypothetical protein [Geobacter]|uniref:Uncharacterized protein n=2 Tax=Geobacter TaxID=28231 RepID=A0A0C1TKV7_9BACT|nr:MULTISPECIES: hypothetical protein [Geobacter]ANA39665.1 hypothetical protein A2G06_03990 [Geobacter anodireducens]KIE41129.1 hypothetical protein SE37_16465 [Geobacter soli]KIE41444.1 hypothetical protein SE37_01750 [Geobacter soli]MBE2888010.1 hypothetical protein [Geobacter anodireducens]HMN03419.1 hypothetical protein [Geobacter anodireducens]
MQRFLAVLFAMIFICSAAVAAGGLDGFLGNLNVEARADPTGFAGRLSTQFGVPGAQVSVVLGSVREPADAFMVYQLGQMTHKPYETVLQSYQANQGKGWGVIAKRLGIKPGSTEFHALKRGDFALTGKPSHASHDDHHHGREKAKGKGKGKGY